MLAVHCLSALQVYNEMFTDATSERTERMFHYLDPDNTGYVDYLGWSQSIKLQVRNLIMITCYRTCCRNAAVVPALLHLHRCDSRQPSWCDVQQSMFSKLASDAKLSPRHILVQYTLSPERTGSLSMLRHLLHTT